MSTDKPVYEVTLGIVSSNMFPKACHFFVKGMAGDISRWYSFSTRATENAFQPVWNAHFKMTLLARSKLHLRLYRRILASPKLVGVKTISLKSYISSLAPSESRNVFLVLNSNAELQITLSARVVRHTSVLPFSSLTFPQDRILAWRQHLSSTHLENIIFFNGSGKVAYRAQSLSRGATRRGLHGKYFRRILEADIRDKADVPLMHLARRMGGVFGSNKMKFDVWDMRPVTQPSAQNAPAAGPIEQPYWDALEAKWDVNLDRKVPASVGVPRSPGEARYMGTITFSPGLLSEGALHCETPEGRSFAVALPPRANDAYQWSGRFGHFGEASNQSRWPQDVFKLGGKKGKSSSAISRKFITCVVDQGNDVGMMMACVVCAEVVQDDAHVDAMMAKERARWRRTRGFFVIPPFIVY